MSGKLTDEQLTQGLVKYLIRNRNLPPVPESDRLAMEHNRRIAEEPLQPETIDDIKRIMDRIGITNIEDIIEDSAKFNTTTYESLKRTEELLNSYLASGEVLPVNSDESSEESESDDQFVDDSKRVGIEIAPEVLREIETDVLSQQTS